MWVWIGTYIVGLLPVCFMQSSTSNCTVQFTRWKLKGQCALGRDDFPQGSQTCRWTELKDSSSGYRRVFSSTMSVKLDENGQPCNHTCALDSYDLPTGQGSYSYRVDLGNGYTPAKFLGVNVIEIPRPPTWSCSPSNGFIQEGSHINCTCSTTSLGLPEGRLKWMTKMDNVITSYRGNYSEKFLQWDLNFTGKGDNGLQLLCDMEWAQDVCGEPFTAGWAVDVCGKPYTVRVFAANLFINSREAQSVTVPEGESVTVVCATESGDQFPQHNVILTDADGKVVLSSSNTSNAKHLSQIHIIPKASCKDSGLYTCIARGKGGFNASSTTMLFVSCKPRRENLVLPSLRFEGTATSVTFDVIAYPVPEVTFAFLGPSAETRRSIPRDVTLEGLCVQGHRIYEAKCVITVQAMSSDDTAGFYEVSLINDVGQADLSLEIKFGGGLTQDCGTYLNVAIGTIIALVVLIIAFIVIAVIWRRRVTGRQKQHTVQQLSLQELQNPTRLRGSDLYLTPISTRLETTEGRGDERQQQQTVQQNSPQELQNTNGPRMGSDLYLTPISTPLETTEGRGDERQQQQTVQQNSPQELQNTNGLRGSDIPGYLSLISTPLETIGAEAWPEASSVSRTSPPRRRGDSSHIYAEINSANMSSDPLIRPATSASDGHYTSLRASDMGQNSKYTALRQ